MIGTLVVNGLINTLRHSNIVVLNLLPILRTPPPFRWAGERRGGRVSLLLNFQKGVTFLTEVAIFPDKPIYRGELSKKGGLDISDLREGLSKKEGVDTLMHTMLPQF